MKSILVALSVVAIVAGAVAALEFQDCGMCVNNIYSNACVLVYNIERMLCIYMFLIIWVAFGSLWVNCVCVCVCVWELSNLMRHSCARMTL